MLAQPSGLLLGRPREWVKAANVHGAAPSSSRRYETHAAEVCRQSADGDDTHPNDVAAAGDHKSLMKRWRRQLGLVVSDLPERPRLGRHDLRERLRRRLRNVMVLGWKKVSSGFETETKKWDGKWYRLAPRTQYILCIRGHAFWAQFLGPKTEPGFGQKLSQ